MRKSSQSMYQPGKGNPSQRFTSLVEGIGLTKSIVNAPVRKLEGQDMRQTTDLGKLTSKTTFQQTIGNLKNRPQQRVLEDEYISGLQQEIKYLEYELKLLKDKQLLEREGVNELDNFLKDEIPINENILAMKNKYNATKAKLEQQFLQLTGKNAQAADVLKTQQNEIERLHSIIDAHRKQKEQRAAEFKQKLQKLIAETTLTNEEYAATSEDTRRLQEHAKRMNEQISMIQRQIEKEKVLEVRVQEERTKKTEKFEERARQAKEQLIENNQKVEELEALGEQNPLLDPLQEQNSTLRKKIMLNDKQRSTAENTIAEIELFLKEESREREIERQQKLKLLVAAEECRTEIQQIDRYAENMVRDETSRTRKLQLKEMANDFQEKEDTYELLTDRLRNLEQECSNLIQQKKQLQDALQQEATLEKELKGHLVATDGIIVSSKSRADSLRRVAQEIVGEVTALQDEVEKCKGRIPLVEKDIEKKSTSIHYLNKQIDILKELKSLDLEQLQLISQGGSQMQSALHSFIKNWEKIKSL